MADYPGWLSAIVALVALIAAGVGSYTGVKIGAAEMRRDIAHLRKDHEDLKRDHHDEASKNHKFRGQMTRGYIMVQVCCEKLGVAWPHDPGER